MEHYPSAYQIAPFQFSDLTYSFILKHSAVFVSSDKRAFTGIVPKEIALNQGVFENPGARLLFPSVVVSIEDSTLVISAGCSCSKNRFCEHQIQVLLNLLDRDELRIFFDSLLRTSKMLEVAKEYGLEQEQHPEAFFEVIWKDKTAVILPLNKSMLPVNATSEKYVKQHLLPLPTTFPSSGAESTQLIVLARHRYYDQFVTELFSAPTGKDGKVKNPFLALDPLELLFKLEKPEELKFYTALARFQQPHRNHSALSDLESLKALVRNPLNLPAFYHDNTTSENITASSVVPVDLKESPTEIQLLCHLKGSFHEISGILLVDGVACELHTLRVRFRYFVQLHHTLYLVSDPEQLRIMEFFNKHEHLLLIHVSKFEAFRKTVLSEMEGKVKITYSHIQPATPEQLEESGFDHPTQKLLYLSESEDFVLMTPVIRYGNVEVPLLSKKQVIAEDQNGNHFTVLRNEALEINYTALFLKQHNDFADQLHGDSFYLHKERFMANGWFLKAFEEWQLHEMTVLGFKELKNIRLNPHRAVISVLVTSGINWFDTTLQISFGGQEVSLKHLHKSIRNKSKFVQLGDGTLGMLPDEWLEKFATYFQSGEVTENKIRTPLYRYTSVTELYEEQMLSQEVKQQLLQLKKGFADFESIRKIPVPAALKATLRPYQQQGLNWLHFLDEFRFGGCLADDMGLGKTLQVIAFMLSLKEKKKKGPHLVVVPTSLVGNWESELRKFAPSLRVGTLHGAGRAKHTLDFDSFDVLITTYGVLLSDIRYLKDYAFHYVFLDESQAIKNPESQRYKAASLLTSFNRVVLTGTPVENNTFDLYGQLSFACPGLLGSKQYFKDIFSVPIDTFGDLKRARQLQQRIHPFILRRTKKQVAHELPEKTEMVIYCEMGESQRKVYQAQEKELRDYIATRWKEGLPRESMYVLKGITRLRQICNSPALLKDETFYGGTSAKLEVLMEEIRSKSAQHKILVFSQFVSMLDMIRKELITSTIPFEYLTGQSSGRTAKVATFQENDAIRVFLISLKAGGVGLNLTEADYVYLVDPWWNPAVENQAIDRCYRIGQEKHVIAVRLICPDSIEEKMMKLQESKKELAGELIRTDAAVLKSLSKEELLRLF